MKQGGLGPLRLCVGVRVGPEVEESVRDLVLVGVGGMTGAILRYLVSSGVQRLSPSLPFPVGTLTVNGVGCFAIGAVAALAVTRPQWGGDVWLLLVVGVLGGFTTFSAFGLETFDLLRRGMGGMALLVVLVQVGVGVASVAAGFALFRNS